MRAFQYVLGGLALLLTVGIGYANTAGPLAMAWDTEKVFDLGLALMADVFVVVTLWSAMELHRHRHPLLVFVMVAFWGVASVAEVNGAHHWLTLQTANSGAPAAKADELAQTAQKQLEAEQANLNGINGRLLLEKNQAKLEDLRRSKDASEKRIAELTPKSSRAAIVATSNQWAGFEWHVAVALWLASQVCWGVAMLDLSGRKRRDPEAAVIDVTPRHPAPEERDAAESFRTLGREITLRPVALSFTSREPLFSPAERVKRDETPGETQAQRTPVALPVKAIEPEEDFSAPPAEISSETRDETPPPENAPDTEENCGAEPAEIAAPAPETTEPTEEELRAEVVRMLGEGSTQRAIAARLGISPSRVSRIVAATRAKPRGKGKRVSPANRNKPKN